MTRTINKQLQNNARQRKETEE
uniref:Uncharacterized protein n=1 Tax=Caenorhabditis japonica TaxID=281687 RepID=A0A8R1IA29_CAEJA